MLRPWIVAAGIALSVGGCGKDGLNEDLVHLANANARYQAKVKALEAREMLKKLYEGARAYYVAQGNMGPSARRFPGPSAGPTPPLGTCCKNASRKCKPDAGLWAASPWKELRFSLPAEHYFSYTVKVNDSGDYLTVRANGDLDCDGKYSTFEMFGHIVLDEPVTNGWMVRIHETE